MGRLAPALLIVALLLVGVGVILGALIERKRTRIDPKRYADMEDFLLGACRPKPSVDPRDIVVLTDELKALGEPIVTQIEAERAEMRRLRRLRGY